jgi:hypothetical protein
MKAIIYTQDLKARGFSYEKRNFICNISLRQFEYQQQQLIRSCANMNFLTLPPFRVNVCVCECVCTENVDFSLIIHFM